MNVTGNHGHDCRTRDRTAGRIHEAGARCSLGHEQSLKIDNTKVGAPEKGHIRNLIVIRVVSNCRESLKGAYNHRSGGRCHIYVIKNSCQNRHVRPPGDPAGGGIDEAGPGSVGCSEETCGIHDAQVCGPEECDACYFVPVQVICGCRELFCLGNNHIYRAWFNDNMIDGTYNHVNHSTVGYGAILRPHKTSERCCLGRE